MADDVHSVETPPIIEGPFPYVGDADEIWFGHCPHRVYEDSCDYTTGKTFSKKQAWERTAAHMWGKHYEDAPPCPKD